MDEILRIYLARGLSAGETNPDEDEYIEIVRMPFDELLARITSD